MRMKRPGLLFILCLEIVRVGAIDAQAHRLSSEGGRDCSNDALELPAEWTEAMEHPARPVIALADRGKTDSLNPSMSALSVTLLRADVVHLLARPQSGGNSPGSYAGFVSFSVPRDGDYRISSVSPLGIKVFTSEGRLDSHAFEIRSGCDKTFKSFDFELQAGPPYWLELSSSSREVKVMIVPAG